jgi:hypothetical protein
VNQTALEQEPGVGGVRLDQTPPASDNFNQFRGAVNYMIPLS